MALRKTFGSKATLGSLGDFPQILDNVSPSVLLIVSAHDVYGDTPEGRRLLEQQRASTGIKNKAERNEKQQKIVLQALVNFKESMNSVHPALWGVFEQNHSHIVQSIKRAASNEPCAMPFIGDSGTMTFGLIILGQPVAEAKNFLAIIGNIPAHEITQKLESSPEKIQNIILLHEAFHLRPGVDWSASKKTDFEKFVEEVRADRFALTEAKKLHGYEPSMADYMAARQVSAVHGGTADHMTGLAVQSLPADAEPEAYRPYFAAAQNFQKKIHDVARKMNDMDAILDIPKEILDLLALARKFKLDEGLRVVMQLKEGGSLSPLESKMADLYIDAVGRWVDVENGPKAAGRWAPQAVSAACATS